LSCESISTLADLFKFLDEGYFLAYNVDDGEVLLVKRVNGALRRVSLFGAAKKYMLRNYRGKFMVLIEVERGDWMESKRFKAIRFDSQGVISVDGVSSSESLPDAAISALSFAKQYSSRALDAFCDMAVRIVELLRESPELDVDDLIDRTGYPKTIVMFLLGALSTFKGSS